MPVVQLSTAPNRADYERVARLVDLDRERPGGLILHAACELPDGGVQIVDVWDSTGSLAVFASRILPAFAEAGLAEHGSAGPQPTTSDVFHLVR